jgi:hypothetical protein
LQTPEQRSRSIEIMENNLAHHDVWIVLDNSRRGHYELGVEARHERLRVAAAFDELAEAI